MPPSLSRRLFLYDTSHIKFWWAERESNPHSFGEQVFETCASASSAIRPRFRIAFEERAAADGTREALQKQFFRLANDEIIAFSAFVVKHALRSHI